MRQKLPGFEWKAKVFSASRFEWQVLWALGRGHGDLSAVSFGVMSASAQFDVKRVRQKPLAKRKKSC